MLKNKSKIDKILSEDFVKNSVIKWLSANGWGYFQFGGLRDKGVDIKAKHQNILAIFLLRPKARAKSDKPMKWPLFILSAKLLLE